jgi:hypothetical protein
VAIVLKGSNRIQLMFKASSIRAKKDVVLADGKRRKNGYIINADRETIVRPKPSTPLVKNFLPAVGGFGYFRSKITMTPIVVGDPPKPRGSKNSQTPGYPDMPHGNEEATLVKSYIAWMGNAASFESNIYANGSFPLIDLFNFSHWQLIEAKIDTSRETIRMAIGQLFDYKRYYKRSPSLAILLPARPSDSCMDLLTDNHVSVIWKNGRGAFSMRRWQD